jgi:hypothetical protein
MACDSGPGPSYYGELKAAENQLCRTRWVLLQLRKHLDSTKLPSSLNKYAEEEKEAQLKHRREDKESAANTVKQNLYRVNDDIEKIVKLGGSPSPTLLAKRDGLNNLLIEVKQVSDDQLLEGSWCNRVTIVDIILGGE